MSNLEDQIEDQMIDDLRFPALKILGTDVSNLINESQKDDFCTRWSLNHSLSNLPVYIRLMENNLDDINICKSVSSGLGILHTEPTIDVTEVSSYIYANLEIKLSKYGLDIVDQVVNLGVYDMNINGLREEDYPSRMFLILP